MTSIDRTAAPTFTGSSSPSFLALFFGWLRGSLRTVLHGGAAYWTWVLLLLVVIGLGTYAYALQVIHGMIVTNLPDQLSWGFYIGNFAYLVGVAAAGAAWFFYGDQIRLMLAG